MKKKPEKNFRQQFSRPVNPKPPAATPVDNEESDGSIRLNKYVAHCGIASRRKAAELIQQGFVTVNDEVITEPGHRLMPEDKVSYKGKPIEPEQNKIYLLLNKPKDVITTVDDERGRRTVLDIVGKEIKERVFPVGRLDRATTGLLLITNDGDLAKKLSHPSHNIKKVYHVVLDQAVSQEHIEQIAAGLELEDGHAPVDGVSHIIGKGPEEVGIEIHIGRNRIVRRIFEHLGYNVLRLDRTFYAGLTKKDLPRGHYRHLSDREIIMLRHFV